LAVSEVKFSRAQLMAVVTAEGRKVKRVNEPAHGGVAMRSELRASDRNDLSPLLATAGSVIFRYQHIRQRESTSRLGRKRGWNRIARSRVGQDRAEFATKPEGL
jgi:hypothetical protein